MKKLCDKAAKKSTKSTEGKHVLETYEDAQRKPERKRSARKDKAELEGGTVETGDIGVKSTVRRQAKRGTANRAASADLITKRPLK